MFGGFQVWYARVRMKKLSCGELSWVRGHRLVLNQFERICWPQRRDGLDKEAVIGEGAVAAGGAVCR